MKTSDFKFHTQLRVRNYEIDWQGIVHNSNYLLYFEVGRIDYLRQIGVHMNLDSVNSDSRVVLVRNVLNYLSSARFDDVLNVYTRVAYVKNTSFGFEGMIEDAATGRVIGENVAIHVWLHPQTGRPIPVNDEFRDAVRKFEGESVEWRTSSKPEQP